MKVGDSQFTCICVRKIVNLHVYLMSFRNKSPRGKQNELKGSVEQDWTQELAF